jgi:hypothetical protein
VVAPVADCPVPLAIISIPLAQKKFMLDRPTPRSPQWRWGSACWAPRLSSAVVGTKQGDRHTTPLVEIARNDNNDHRAIRRVATDRRRGGLMALFDKVKDLLAKNADKVDTAIDKAGDIVDSKTQGKYSDTVNKVQDAAKKAVDKGNPQT